MNYHLQWGFAATILTENFSFNAMIEVLGRRGELGKRMLRSDMKAELRARFNCKKLKSET